MAMTETITVEVVFATAERQVLLALDVPVGTTAEQAVALSGIAAQFPETAMSGLKLGIFGKVVAGSRVLASQDRVEIYRPLLADPKTVRRERVEAGRTRKNRPR